MYKFDVKYTLENYLEYYKFVLIRSKIVRDIIFSSLFLAVAIYWLVDSSESTANIIVPIFALVMAVIFPLMNLLTLPMLKKQLNARQGEIDRTHIVVTFNDEDVVYENLTVVPEIINPVEEEKPVNEVSSENTDENNEEASNEKEDEVSNETATDEKEAQEVENTETASTDETIETLSADPSENEKIFVLKYNNFQLIRELDNLFLFYLDRQTIVILPKSTFVEGSSLDDFKTFILGHVNPKRIKFKKVK